MKTTSLLKNCVLSAALMLISILGNALVLAAIIRTIVRLKRNTLNSFVFYLALSICYLPVYVLWTPLIQERGPNQFKFAFTAVFMNSSINAFLYSRRLWELRTAVVKTARQIMLCKKKIEENFTQNVSWTKRSIQGGKYKRHPRSFSMLDRLKFAI